MKARWGRTSVARATAGFTLVEVLVALAVASLTLSAFDWLTDDACRMEARIGSAAVARESVQAAERLFRAVVDGAMPGVRRERSEGPVGAADTLTLFSRGPAILMLDRPHPMTLQVEREAGGAALSLAWRDSDSGADRRETVLEDAKEVSFAYFGGRDGIPNGWRHQWDWPWTLPRGILMRNHRTAALVEVVVLDNSELPAAISAGIW